MKTLPLVGVSSLLSRVARDERNLLSLTYMPLERPKQTGITQDTPLSLSGGGEGATFTGSAHRPPTTGPPPLTRAKASPTSRTTTTAPALTITALMVTWMSPVHYTMRVSGPVTGARSCPHHDDGQRVFARCPPGRSAAPGLLRARHRQRRGGCRSRRRGTGVPKAAPVIDGLGAIADALPLQVTTIAIS